MNLNAASKQQKLKWIADGEYIDDLCNDTSNWIKIAARKKRIELCELHENQELQDFKTSMDADLFEVIKLSAKTDDEVHELIRQNKYLTYFANCNNLSYRVRAKHRIDIYLGELETHRSFY